MLLRYAVTHAHLAESKVYIKSVMSDAAAYLVTGLSSGAYAASLAPVVVMRVTRCSPWGWVRWDTGVWGTPCSFVVVARMMERNGAGYDRRARYMRLGECQKFDEREWVGGWNEGVTRTTNFDP